MLTPEGAAVLGLAIIAGLAGGYLFARLQARSRLRASQARAKDHEEQAQTRSRDILEAAQKDAERLLKDAELRAKDETFQKREEFNREMELARAEIREQERRLEKREDASEQKHQLLLKKERMLENAQKKLADRREAVEKRGKELDDLIQQQTAKLHELAGLSRDQAERLLVERLERELTDEIATRIQRHEERYRTEGEQRAREILATAIQRYAAEHTADTTVSTVDIPSDDMKGRIIGREGRNIRTFEKCTGVDVIVDDTPGVVIVSAFDNIRR